jgi:hypothetical protein
MARELNLASIAIYFIAVLDIAIEVLMDIDRIRRA